MIQREYPKKIMDKYSYIDIIRQNFHGIRINTTRTKYGTQIRQILNA